mgnify:CR=1 FL=1
MQASPAATPENLMSCAYRQRAWRGKRRERTHLVLPNHDLLNRVAHAELDQAGVVERTRNLSTRDESQTFDALEIGVLDAHDARLGEEGLGVVVDELAVDEAGHAVGFDLGDLGLHLLLVS